MKRNVFKGGAGKNIGDTARPAQWNWILYVIGFVAMGYIVLRRF